LSLWPNATTVKGVPLVLIVRRDEHNATKKTAQSGDLQDLFIPELKTFEKEPCLSSLAGPQVDGRHPDPTKPSHTGFSWSS